MPSVGIVLNTHARNYANHKAYIDALDDNGITYVLYQYGPKNLDEAIKKCLKNHAIILVGGGDGTVRSAAQYCVNQSVILGVLPLGTMNHFFKELGLPESAEDLVQALKKKHVSTIDVAEVNARIFVNNSSLGFYPAFTKKRERYTKFYNKWLCYVPSFIQTLKRHKTFHLNIKNKEINLNVRTSFLMISNNLYSYKFPFSFERESFHSSLLGIYFFKHGHLQILKILRHFLNKKNNFEVKETQLPIEVSVLNEKTVPISIDGETMNIETPLIYKTLPSALKILTKKL